MTGSPGGTRLEAVAPARNSAATLLIAAVLVTLGLAGCAGSSEEQDETAGAVTVGRADELVRYFDAVHTEEARYADVRQRTVDAFAEVHTDGPDETWPAAAGHLDAARDSYDSLAGRMAAISPPARLAAAHGRLVTSLRLLAGLARDAEEDLAGEDLAAVQGWPVTFDPLINRVIALRQAWRSAVTGYARGVGVLVPEWVGVVGEPYAGVGSNA